MPMKDIKDSPGIESVERTRVGYSEHFKQSGATTVNRAIAALLHGRTEADLIVNLFDGRTTYDTIRQWQHGRRSIPQWAIDLLKSKVARINETVDALRPGPGREVTRRNLTSWRARQNL